MARIGITLHDVEDAALKLQGQGRHPTVDSIREQLGTGSKSTIAQHLKTWRGKQGELQGKLPHELTALVGGLWERLNSQAEARIIKIENESESTINELKQTLTQSQQEQVQLKAKLHQQEETLAAEQRAKQEIEENRRKEQQTHDKLQDRHDTLNQQLEDSKAENSRLHQLAKQIQANLEHYQEAVQQQRTEQALLMEKQQAQFQQETALLRRELAEQQSQNQQGQKELSQKTAAIEQSQEQHLLLQQKYDQLLKERQETDRDLIIAIERFDQHQQQLRVHEHALTHKNQELITLEKQVAILANQNDGLKADYENVIEKVEILRNEKIFLVQEKSELLGQLKQLIEQTKNRKETALQD